jgi:hypothetical protein
MITVGDITEYEPPTPKLIAISSSIIIMLAGDMGLQAEIMRDLQPFTNDRIAKNPNEWLRVKHVVEWYKFYYAQLKLKRAEAELLLPLGLNQNNYLNQNPDLVAKLAKEILNYEMAGIRTIITGIDAGGPHIYMTDGVDVTCCDTSGFAAVGTGSYHASSQFMLARHSWNSPLADTLLRVYIAKKRAEAAPGVGKDTDMFLIGPQLGYSSMVRPDVLAKLEKIYQKLIKGEAKTLKDAEKEMKAHVKRLIKAGTKKEQGVSAPAERGSAPALEAPAAEPSETPPAAPEGS